jgi:hypothetical protein
METSAVGVRESVSVAKLSVVFGSEMVEAGVTVAVFDTVPVAELFTVAVMRNVAVPPAWRSTTVAIEPEPLVAAHVACDEAVHVQVASTRLLGSVSETMVPGASEGPLFLTTIE